MHRRRQRREGQTCARLDRVRKQASRHEPDLLPKSARGWTRSAHRHALLPFRCSPVCRACPAPVVEQPPGSWWCCSTVAPVRFACATRRRRLVKGRAGYWTRERDDAESTNVDTHPRKGPVYEAQSDAESTNVARGTWPQQAIPESGNRDRRDRDSPSRCHADEYASPRLEG